MEAGHESPRDISRFLDALADPLRQTVVSTPPRFPTWLPLEARAAITRGVLPDGVSHFRDGSGHIIQVHVERRDGMIEIGMVGHVPDDEEHYVRLGFAAEAHLLAATAKRYNQDMYHLVTELGWSPDSARRTIRETNDAVFRACIESFGSLMTQMTSLSAFGRPFDRSKVDVALDAVRIDPSPLLPRKDEPLAMSTTAQ